MTWAVPAALGAVIVLVAGKSLLDTVTTGAVEVAEPKQDDGVDYGVGGASGGETP